MNQRKIGEFLKQLRKNKGLTQEQLAEHFYVSSRTVSRWETGNNMPDLTMLIELADFYEVEIREIIDGERKSEIVENENNETLQKVAEYAVEEKRKQGSKRIKALLAGLMLVLTSDLLFSGETKGFLNGIVSEIICNVIIWIALGVQFVIIIESVLFFFGITDKFVQWQKNRNKNG